MANKQEKRMDYHYEANFYDTNGLHFFHMSAFRTVEAAKKAAKASNAFYSSRVTIVDWYGCRTIAEKLPNRSNFRTITQ